MPADSFEKVVNLCARRALIFPSAEPYAALTSQSGGSGFAGFFDYAGYGAMLKRRVEADWFKRFVDGREDVVALDASIVTPRAVLEASGHLASFNDPLVECNKCHSKYRADHLVEQELKKSVDGLSLERLAEMLIAEKIVCPKCKGALSEIKTFNLMFPTIIGAAGSAGVKADEAPAFLRPETAQSMFVDFPRLALACRQTLPFGIAQAGRVFRNEIAPRNFVFRCREFSQLEIEFFVHPWKLDECAIPKKLSEIEIAFLDSKAQHEQNAQHDKAEAKEVKKESFAKLVYDKTIANKWVAYWLAEYVDWFASIGIPTQRLRLRQHTSDELSHYSRETWDVEYDFPGMGWKELMGVADRGDYDLKAHAKRSGKEFGVYDDAAKQKIVPFVVEPSLGVDRLIFTLLCEAYTEKKEDGKEKKEESKDGKSETKTILALSPKIAPVTVCVFPLMKKDGLAEKAREVFEALRAEGFAVEYDEGGSIGKRYARSDEIGVVACVTIDYDSLEKNDCTIRERDTAEQERVKTRNLPAALRKLLETA